jgi:hypothetical protein
MAGLVLLPVAWLFWLITGGLRSTLSGIAYAAVVCIAVMTLHYVLSQAEDRGWIYYRKRRGSYGGLGTTSEWLNLYDPSRRYVQEAKRRQEWQRDEDDDGDGGNDGPGGATRGIAAGSVRAGRRH